jgi:hypothetical protein
VKDFESQDISVSDAFMTNADVPTLATKGIIDNPINPFTGKEITDSEKNAHAQYIIMSDEWKIEKNDGNTFLPSSWASIQENLWDNDKWFFYEGDMILDEHNIP